MTRYADPYTPSAVPVSADEAPLWAKDMERFLTDELAQIADAIQQTSVMAAYGGLLIETPKVAVIGATPVQIPGWDRIVPDEPNRIEGDTGNGELTLTEDGTYFVQSQITANTTSGRVYAITLAVNGVLSSIAAKWDTSNQTNSVNMIFGGMADLRRGDVLSTFVAANLAGSTFDIQAATFNVFRISELRQIYT